MKLKDLVKNVNVKSIHGPEEIEVSDFHFDSRLIADHDLFVAVKGTQVDGYEFIEKAVGKGAVAIVCESFPKMLKDGVTYVLCADTEAALATIAANFYGNPAAKLKMVGITGTNGKTSVATLLHRLFQDSGQMAGLVSTISYKIGNETKTSSHTTPDPKQLHQLFAEMVECGCETCFMEVSSHSLMQKRTWGIPFRIAVFTNITHDHLDYHGTFAEYIKAKKKLFDVLNTDAIALINLDDRNASVMVQNSKAKVKTFARRRMADYKVKLLENTFEGLLLLINDQEVWFRLLGSFNAYNLVTAYAVAVELGMESDEALRYLSQNKGVEGRFQAIYGPEKSRTAVVDYAHTPDALENVLQTLVDIQQGGGRIITVTGCGGDRDKTKRPKMANIAAELSDQLIITSDNPRFEEVDAIIKDMEAGLSVANRRKSLIIASRKEAIRTAVRLAKKEDIILIAGKGHETYQDIKGVKHDFDDRKVVSQAMEE